MMQSIFASIAAVNVWTMVGAALRYYLLPDLRWEDYDPYDLQQLRLAAACAGGESMR
jgi:hypothetical protein